MIEPISLTQTQYGNLQQLGKFGIKNKNFNPDSIDLTMPSFSYIQKDGKSKKDAIVGFMRFLKEPKFGNRQVKWLKDKIKLHGGLNCRYLIGLPHGFLDYDGLRDSFVKIQEEARLPKTYLFVGKDETFGAVKDYMDKMGDKGEIVLVLPIDMNEESLSRLIYTYAPRLKEICFLYKVSKKNENLDLLITKATIFPEKFHMAFVPVDSTSFGKPTLIPTALICSKFKSVSTIDAGIPGYILKNIDRRGNPSTLTKKLKRTIWINNEASGYEQEHPKDCICLDSKIDVWELFKNCGINTVLAHHTLEVLSFKFKMIKSDEKERKRVLELPPIKNLINSWKT